jgi:Xaa-Pro aminopeptidase
MKRRELIQSTAALGGLAATAGWSSQLQAATARGIAPDILRNARAAPPMNMARAYEVMEQQQLGGLVLAAPVNVYHTTGYWPQLAKMGYQAPAFALLSADRNQAPGLVMSQFLYYYIVADANYGYPLQTWLYTGGRASEPSAPFIFEDLGQEPLGEVEKSRRAALDEAMAQNPLEPAPGNALVKALREMGLDRGRIGIDHLSTTAAFESAGLNAQLVNAENTLRRIRLVKSDREIQLMRHAAQTNADAALAAAASVRAGLTVQELRAQFFSEASKLGNTPTFMTIDRMNSETGNARFREGQAFFIDCVSHCLHYHGDFGRTVFIGEPVRSMQRAVDAISLGWDAVREKLRPGLRYSEIPRIGNEAVRKAGYKFGVAFTPHSVGLFHTDEPGQDGTPYFVKDDLVLEENMILSVDCPIRNVGVGGSAHLEDLTLITADGSEQINDIGNRTIIV